MRHALARRPSARARRRIERLLRQLADPLRPRPPDELRDLRAAEILELIGTEQARGVLQAVASGATRAPVTREAAKALRRLKARPSTAG